MPNRRRSEYRLDLRELTSPYPDLDVRPAADFPIVDLATLLLAAYRGTIDDEGEDLDDAIAAIEHYLDLARTDRAAVLVDRTGPIALCFVVTVGGTEYIDPIVVAPDRKRERIGLALVSWMLHRLRSDDVEEVGATITDGNVASERLFGGLGFRRVGPWP